MDEYATIGELLYHAQEAAREAAKMSENKPLNIKYDLYFLIDIALDNKDHELFKWCMEVNN